MLYGIGRELTKDVINIILATCNKYNKVSRYRPYKNSASRVIKTTRAPLYLAVDRDEIAPLDLAVLDDAGLLVLEGGTLEEAVGLAVMLDADILLDAILELESALLEDIIPPIIPPIGASFVVADLAAVENLSRVISDPLGLN